MPSREPELYKDKIEVSLDGRQIFYLFFGGAVIVGLVFVVGVMVGRRVEARGHLDRADTQTASDPLAALDRLERSDQLSFHGALTGGEPASDVEKAIGELEKHRAAAKPEKPDVKPDAKPDARPEKSDAKPEVRIDAKPEVRVDAKPEVRIDAKAERSDAKADKPERADKADKSSRAEPRSDKPDAKADKGEPITRPDPDKARPDKHDGERKSKKHDDSADRTDARPDRGDRGDAKHAEGKSDKPVTKPEARGDRSDDRRDRAEAKPSEPSKTRFTLQLSSFQDRSEAEAFLAATRSAGFQAYITEADVGGKGTFYRVRLGSFRSLEAANDAKEEYEKAAKKTAQVMRL